MAVPAPGFNPGRWRALARGGPGALASGSAWAYLGVGHPPEATARVGAGLQPVRRLDQALLLFTLDEGFDLDVAFQAAAQELFAEQLVQLKDPGGVRHLHADA